SWTVLTWPPGFCRVQNVQADVGSQAADLESPQRSPARIRAEDLCWRAAGIRAGVSDVELPRRVRMHRPTNRIAMLHDVRQTLVTLRDEFRNAAALSDGY
ncbi:MAG: hypothetical protein JWN40_3358, partial [Phycisphaerales bacterium]|nr:hypothetical protein [Phycisphaerales bacterium]